MSSVDSSMDNGTNKECCCQQCTWDISEYDDCCSCSYGRCREYWRRYDECILKSKKCCHASDEICVPKSYLPIPCVYPVQCLAVCKNSSGENFQIYVNDLLGFSIHFKIKKYPHKGTITLDNTGKGKYIPYWNSVGFDSFVVTACSVFKNRIIHCVDVTIRVEIEPCNGPKICDLNCECCRPHRDCEE